MMRTVLAALAFAGTLVAAPAQSAMLLFVIGGPIDAAFNLDTETLQVLGPDGVGTTVPGYFAGVEDVADIRFGAVSLDPQVEALSIFTGSAGSFSLFGDQLFAGTVASPLFVPGEFLLTSADHIDPVTLSIIGNDGIISGVPEPSSWALLVVGFGLVGAGMRRRAIAA